MPSKGIQVFIFRTTPLFLINAMCDYTTFKFLQGTEVFFSFETKKNTLIELTT